MKKEAEFPAALEPKKEEGEVRQANETDEVRHLVQAIGRIERPEFFELLTLWRRHVFARPITGYLLGVLPQKGAKSSPERRTAVSVSSARV